MARGEVFPRYHRWKNRANRLNPPLKFIRITTVLTNLEMYFGFANIDQTVGNRIQNMDNIFVAVTAIVLDIYPDNRSKPRIEVIMKYGARNQIIGKVTGIKKGGVMAQLQLDIPAGSKMGSVITIDSLNDLQIKEGDEVKIVIKAINVLIVKE